MERVWTAAGSLSSVSITVGSYKRDMCRSVELLIDVTFNKSCTLIYDASTGTLIFQSQLVLQNAIHALFYGTVDRCDI